MLSQGNPATWTRLSCAAAAWTDTYGLAGLPERLWRQRPLLLSALWPPVPCAMPLESRSTVLTPDRNRARLRNESVPRILCRLHVLEICLQWIRPPLQRELSLADPFSHGHPDRLRR